MTNFIQIFQDNLPIAIVNINISGNILSANITAAKLLGLNNNKQRTFPFSDLFYDQNPNKFGNFLAEAFNTDQILNDEITLRAKTGMVFYCMINASSSFNETFNSTICTLTITDLNSIRRRENKLKVSEENFRFLIEESSDPIFSFTKSGKYIYVNRAFASGVNRNQNEIIGRHIWDVFSPEEAEKRFSAVKYVFETGVPKILEVRVPTSHGDTFYITSVTPIKNDAGKVKTVVCISKDITKRKEAEDLLKISEQSLREANAAKDKLLSILAHDLRNPFGVLINLPTVLHNDFERFTLDEIKDHLKYIIEAATNGHKLLEGLLEWSSTQTGNVRFNPAKFNIKDVILDSCNLLGTPAKQKDITIELNLQNNLMVMADPNMIRTIIRNLITNSLKFTHNGGKITISAEQKNGKIKVSVADNGIGIPEDMQLNLFDFTKSSSKPGTNKEKGNGLGLVVCNEFIKKHNSDLLFESKVGKGSTFSFYLDSAL